VVLVLHAWWGLTPFFMNVCERLAAEGFVALAPDRYGGPTAATIEEAEALQRQREDPVSTEAALGVSVEFLSAHEAVVGDDLCYHELRSTHLLGTWVNKGKKRKGRGC
jgi:carboxymethylenebutenolidase